MTKTRKIGWRFLAAHGALMLGVGLAACTLASLMVSPGFVQATYRIAVVLFASCLLITGFYFGKTVYGERPHLPIANYLITGLLSIVSWSILWLLRSAPVDLRFLSILAGMQGVLWGMWYVRLAFYLRNLPRKAALLCILAGTDSFLGMVLSTQSEHSQLSAVSTVAYYSMFIGIQIFLAAIYLYREMETGVEVALSQSS
jgi:hypothetical protein